MLKVLIVDDHAVVRRGLRQIISETSDIVVAGEAGSAEELVAKLGEAKPDVVTLDISLPGKSGLEALKDVKKDHPKLPILMLSVHPEEQYAIRALKAGAAGYMSKECAPDELIAAIRKISRGGKFVSGTLAEKLASDVGANGTRPLHECLSDREFQVMLMIGAGKAISEIARELNLSVKTISTYRARILEKTELSNNYELMHYVMREGLLNKA